MTKPTIRTMTTARVTVEVEVTTGSWGELCKLDQVYQQAAQEAEGAIRRMFAASGGKARFLGVGGHHRDGKGLTVADNLSVADRAVEALAAVKAMDQGVGLEHPERRAIREMKQIALKIISDALESATRLAYQASDLRDLAAAIKTEAERGE